MCCDENERVDFIKYLHVNVKNEIERKVEKYASYANKGRKEVILQLEEWIWVHLRKDRFPNQ